MIKISLAATTLVAALLAITILMGSWYTVPEGFRGVITTNGRVVGLAEPGLGFKIPIFQDVKDMSIQTQRTRYEKVISYSKDIQLSDNTIDLNFRLPPDRVLEIYSEVGRDYQAVLIEGRLAKVVKEAFGGFTAANIVNERERVGQEIEDELAKQLGPFGVIVVDLQLVNVDFSQQYEQAVEATAQAQAKVLKATQELRQKEIDAEQLIVTAKAEAEARKARAAAQAFEIQAIGDAEASAIKARGQALRDNPDLIRLVAAEKWDGKLPTTMLPGGAVPFIDATSR